MILQTRANDAGSASFRQTRLGKERSLCPDSRLSAPGTTTTPGEAAPAPTPAPAAVATPAAAAAPMASAAVATAAMAVSQKNAWRDLLGLVRIGDMKGCERDVGDLFLAEIGAMKRRRAGRRHFRRRYARRCGERRAGNAENRDCFCRALNARRPLRLRHRRAPFSTSTKQLRR